MASDRADLPWMFAGCVLAVVCSAAAAAMMARATDRPLVHGAEHLQIFARPSQVHDERVRSALGSPPPALDYAPTASIGTAPTVSAVPPRAPAANAPAASSSFTLLSAGRDRATFRGPAGDIVVRRGESVPGLGRVADIAWRDGGWSVVLSGAGTRTR